MSSRISAGFIKRCKGKEAQRLTDLNETFAHLLIMESLREELL
jgi:hypothetical protein